MQRYISFITMTFCIVVTPLLSQAQDSEINKAATDLASRITQDGKKTIAVTDFTDLQGRVTELGRFLAEELSVAFVNTDFDLNTIDRGHIRTLLAEHKLAEQGIIDPETASELGRIAGVDVLIAGTVTELGDGVRLNLKALDTDTAKITAGHKVTISKSSDITGLLRRDVDSISNAKSTYTGAPPDVRAFQNDFLIVRVESVAISEDNRRAILALNFENKNSKNEYVGCDERFISLIDNKANNWGRGRITGVIHTNFKWAKDYPERMEYSTFSPGARTTVTLEFEHSSLGKFDAPSRVSFSLDCVRKVGDEARPFSIGVSRIPVK